MTDKYKIVTLCGCTKFKDEFFKAQKELTLKGNIVISIGIFDNSEDDEVCDDKITEMITDMNKRKIDMSDELMIVDINDSNWRINTKIVEYAKSQGKFIYFYGHPEVYYDNVGGFHDSAIGYNPNGVYCGECTKLSCQRCKNVDSKKEI